ncbi:MAG: hypothetical protein HDR02_15475 [Lachnospiraceae bacterium]|nr:hypothetical protein [Lachnospiraceae bacterium]
MKQMNVKKVVAVLMSMAMAMILFTAVIPVNASEQETDGVAETIVAPRAVACPHCGSSVGRHTSTVWSDWYRTGNERSCTHNHLWGTDLERRRDGIETEICSQCGVKISSRNLSESNWAECHGFD